ncbi:ABC transporter ATP-binding protein [Leptolyngbya sp. CCY15150]|uniref:ABC transporter ATP-binding protein n=1 Tax=Leptolyngbya sp. CCY15150 TaxID=2767772 RepID=UPI0019513663|nr:ABC transporter ATP-binding protein [Leptolyngbya sp. CCY15150]
MDIVEQVVPTHGHPSSQSLTDLSGHSLRIENITHRYGDMIALRDICLDITPGEFISLLGPSGCGKTTLLRVIAGFLKQSSGHILIDGQQVDAFSTSQRGVGIVFQNYALFPHKTVWDNVAYGLRAQGASRGRVANKVGEMLDLVQLGHLAKRYPAELSGGQQQRVAIARALAVEPKLMLLDEPFSALDKNLRLDMQIEIRRLFNAQGITAILVTHDQEEAMSMSDRIAVLSNGEVHQFDSPSQIYDHPATPFVSSFVGNCNHLSGQIIGREAGTCVVEVPGGGRLRAAHDEALAPGTQTRLAVRPENLQVQTSARPYCIPGTVEICIPLGSLMTYEVSIAPGLEIKVSQQRIAGSRLLQPGEKVYLEPVSPAACVLFPAAV